MKQTKTGFTLVELIVVATFAGLLFILFIVQKTNLDALQRDEDRKTAINAMYYALEESFYANNGYYPTTISENNIAVIDPALWTDPDGHNLGDPKSSYSYEAADCVNDKCQKYVLKTTLEKEATYVKTSRH